MSVEMSRIVQPMFDMRRRSQIVIERAILAARYGAELKVGGCAKGTLELERRTGNSGTKLRVHREM